MPFLVFSFALIITISSHRSNTNPSSNTFSNYSSNNTITLSCIGDPDELRALLALASDGETLTICSSQNWSTKTTKNNETAILFRWDLDNLQRRLHRLENWGWYIWRQNWGRDSWKGNFPWPLLVWPKGQQKYPCWYCTARRGEYYAGSGEQTWYLSNLLHKHIL